METTTKNYNHNFAYDELTNYEKVLLNKCYNNTLLSPLECCRVMQEHSHPAKYSALKNVEIYLINEN
jgi:hypothetical protein